MRKFELITVSLVCGMDSRCADGSIPARAKSTTIEAMPDSSAAIELFLRRNGALLAM
jgi:hypothetical protein